MRIAQCALLLLMSGATCGAEVYRSTAPDGTVVYTDRPTANSETIHIATPRASAPVPRVSVAPPEAARAAQASPAEASPAQTAEEPQLTVAELREQRARNCEIARERQERYAISHRLYRTLPNGEREYLSDAQIDEARARAAADVRTWCN